MGNALFCCNDDPEYFPCEDGIGVDGYKKRGVPVYHRQIEDDVIWGESVGEGGTSKVSRATIKSTGEKVVVKCIYRAILSKEDDARVQNEAKILSLLSHPGIVKLLAYYVTSECHYLVMEPVQGGELFERLIEQERYTEADARATVKELLAIVDYMHERGVVHRDLKPENVLLINANDNTQVKLIDFGLATMERQNLQGAVGSPFYVAPEVINGVPYNHKVDVWAIGVIAFLILSGSPPFDGNKISQVFKQIRSADYNFGDEAWKDVSGTAKDFISKALVTEPEQRPDAKQLLQHDWIAALAEDGKHLVRLSSAQNNLRAFCSRRNLRKAELAVGAIVRLQNLVKSNKGNGAGPAEEFRLSIESGTHNSDIPKASPSPLRAIEALKKVTSSSSTSESSTQTSNSTSGPPSGQAKKTDRPTNSRFGRDKPTNQ